MATETSRAIIQYIKAFFKSSHLVLFQHASCWILFYAGWRHWSSSAQLEHLPSPMERFHWVQHRCRQLLQGDSRRGWYSAAERLPSQISLDAHGRPPPRINVKRRTVYARNRPHLLEYSAISKNYKGNGIRTNKYTLLTFIPMNLFQQFHRSLFFFITSNYLAC